MIADRKVAPNECLNGFGAEACRLDEKRFIGYTKVHLRAEVGVMRNLSSIKTEEHARALEQRDRFLQDHPELARLQSSIDHKLGNASTAHNRLVIIHNLMMDSLREMDKRLQEALGRRRTTPHSR